VQADYSNFVFKFPNFRYHDNRGWSEINFFCIVKYADPERISIWSRIEDASPIQAELW